MMKWKGFAIGITAVLLLLVVPVVWAQVNGNESHQLQGVRLQETQYEEVSFYNEEAGLQLGGMLFLPEGEGPFPAVVIIHGSGPSRRDNSWYLTLTHHLQTNGIAVLLPDKRGSVASEGDWRSASFDELATDTLAGVAFLREQEQVDPTRIGVIGMSQGGHFVPLTANQSPDVSFVVNMVGGATLLHEQLVYEENYNLRQMGLLPGFSNLLAYPSAWSIREVRQPEFWDAVGNFDPLPHWQQVTVPALVLYGEDDTNVSSDESAALLRSLGKENIDVRVFAGSGHALADPVGEGQSYIRAEVLQAITDFILVTAHES